MLFAALHDAVFISSLPIVYFYFYLFFFSRHFILSVLIFCLLECWKNCSELLGGNVTLHSELKPLSIKVRVVSTAINTIRYGLDSSL